VYDDPDDVVVEAHVKCLLHRLTGHQRISTTGRWQRQQQQQQQAASVMVASSRIACCTG